MKQATLKPSSPAEIRRKGSAKPYASTSASEPISTGFGPCLCSGLPLTRGEHEAGWLVVDADADCHSRKTAGRAESAKTDHHEGRGMPRMDSSPSLSTCSRSVTTPLA